ncbi:MAG: hypothetical protein GY862_22400 [Gammaproteobacteria bacterium]|nr:hypothetical protein [Gammaproteobacteria bacterium]
MAQTNAKASGSPKTARNQNMMTDKTQEIAEFWRVLQKHEGELAAISTADHPVYDLILNQLHHINPGLYFEFLSELGTSELIITAEGKSSLFPLVNSIVASAPEIPGWSILPLKPKIGFPVTTTWESVTVTIADVVFDPLERKGSGDLGLRIFVPAFNPEDAEDIHNALLRALDHGLGEREFAESVQYTEVLPLPDNALAEDYIPLTELENFIRWRKKRKKGTLP